MSSDLTIMDTETKLAEQCGVDSNTFVALKEGIYAGASDQALKMVLSYCKARGIDPLLRPVHIVPMKVKVGKKDQYGKQAEEWRDTIMTSIALNRIDAARTGQYMGLSDPEFGPSITETLGKTAITYPEYCKITVRRMVQGHIVEFPAIEYWKENYKKTSFNDADPNHMWKSRPFAQLAIRAEMQALRRGFPEAVANDDIDLSETVPTTMISHKQSKLQKVIQIQDEAIKQNLGISTESSMNPDKELLKQQFIVMLSNCKNLDELKDVFTNIIKSELRTNSVYMKELIEEKENRKQTLMDSMKETEKKEIDSSWDEFKSDAETGEIK
jgi:phage recombination protein Bet